MKVFFRLLTLAREIPGVEDVHALRTRRVGSGYHVDLHVLVDGGLTVTRGHAIGAAVKRRLIETGPEVLDVVVHLEPQSAGGKGGSGKTVAGRG